MKVGISLKFVESASRKVHGNRPTGRIFGLELQETPSHGAEGGVKEKEIAPLTYWTYSFRGSSPGLVSDAYVPD
jgi:hypothetical protein